MNERSPPRFSPRLPRPLLAATRAGRWSLLAMLSAVLAGGFLLVLFWQQLQVRTPLNQALRDLRQARIELVTGDLYLTLAARPDATLQAAQGMALVRQSLQALETIGQSVSRELVAAGEPAPSDLSGPVDALRVQLARQNADSAVQALELRLAMQAVDRSAARLDEQLNDWLQRLRAQHERLFLESLMVAAGLLVALAGALALHFRAQRRHAGALIRYHEGLEAQVAWRRADPLPRGPGGAGGRAHAGAERGHARARSLRAFRALRRRPHSGPPGLLGCRDGVPLRQPRLCRMDRPAGGRGRGPACLGAAHALAMGFACQLRAEGAGRRVAALRDRRARAERHRGAHRRALLARLAGRPGARHAPAGGGHQRR